MRTICTPFTNTNQVSDPGSGCFGRDFVALVDGGDVRHHGIRRGVPDHERLRARGRRHPPVLRRRRGTERQGRR
jgi:hypothetical protein